MTKITVDNNAEPATPAAGRTVIWSDATIKTLKSKDDAGVISAYGDTKKVLCSSNDTTEGFLEDKITAGAGLTISTTNDGGNETVEIASAAGNPMVIAGGYNASTNTPDLDTSPSSISVGSVYIVNVGGNFFTELVEPSDTITAITENPTTLADWVVVQGNLTPATIKSNYESNADTNALTDAGLTKLDAFSYDTAFTDFNLRIETGAGDASAATGLNNISLGNGAYASTSTGNDNIAIGRDSMSTTTANAGLNVAIGLNTLKNIATGDQANVAIGCLALGGGASHASLNTAVGYNAGFLATQSRNVFLGYNCGSSLTTGAKNILIGYSAQPSAINVNTECTIGASDLDKFRIPGCDFDIDTNSMVSYGLVWRDNIQSLNSAKASGANQPSWSALTGGIYTHDFSNSAMNEVFISFHIDHDYAMGTDVFPHIHWVTNGTNTGTVRWGMECSYANSHQQGASSVFPTSNTIYVEQAASGTTLEHHLAEGVTGVLGTDLEPDGMLMMRIFRDAAHVNDTCTDNCFGISVDLHYQASQTGTISKAPDFFTP